MVNFKHQKHKNTNSTKALRRRSDGSIYMVVREPNTNTNTNIGVFVFEKKSGRKYIWWRENQIRDLLL